MDEPAAGNCIEFKIVCWMDRKRGTGVFCTLVLVAMIDFFKNSTRLAVQTQPPSEGAKAKVQRIRSSVVQRAFTASIVEIHR
jgi:hypothetical protein